MYMPICFFNQLSNQFLKKKSQNWILNNQSVIEAHTLNFNKNVAQIQIQRLRSNWTNP